MEVLPDVLAHGLDIVFCGTAAGTASALRKAYYAGPGNRFWPTLAAVGLTPRLLAPEEFSSVTQYRLGLTDLAKLVSGADAVLMPADFDRDGLRDKMLRFQPRMLAFTSKRAAVEYLCHAVDYGPQEQTIGTTALYVLPSPSGAARGHWDPGHWQRLAGQTRC